MRPLSATAAPRPVGRIFCAAADTGQPKASPRSTGKLHLRPRYDLPNNIVPYRTARLDHFFDAFPRNKWFTLHEPINKFLATSLHDWRTHVDGRVWIFEDLMKHATRGIPFPGVELLAADLQAAKAENVQGYLFESYLQGWNSFAADLWILARLCRDTASDVREWQRRYFRMLFGRRGGKNAGLLRTLR